MRSEFGSVGAGFIVACFLVAGQPLLAQEAEIAACATISDEGERLACFDTLAAKLAPGDPSEASGKWEVASQVSPIDDGTNVYLSLEAEDTVEDLLEGTVRPRLWLQCEEGATSAFVDWGFPIGGGQKQLTARLDREDAETAVLQISDDFRSIGGFRGPNVVDYVQRMLAATLFTVRTTSISNDPLTVTFDLRGLDEAIQPLRQSCNW